MRRSWNMKPQSAVVLLSNQACFVCECASNTASHPSLFIPSILSSRLDSFFPFCRATAQKKEWDHWVSPEPVYLSVLVDTPTEAAGFLLTYSHIRDIQCRNMCSPERCVGEKRFTTGCVKRPWQGGWYVSSPCPLPPLHPLVLLRLRLSVCVVCL